MRPSYSTLISASLCALLLSACGKEPAAPIVGALLGATIYKFIGKED